MLTFADNRLHLQITSPREGQELKQSRNLETKIDEEAMGDVAYWLASHDLSILFSYSPSTISKRYYHQNVLDLPISTKN